MSSVTDCFGPLHISSRTGEPGVIVSPNYGNGYPINMHCTWNVSYLYSDVTAIKFRVSNLDIHDTGDCGDDYLLVCTLVLHSAINCLYIAFKVSHLP